MGVKEVRIALREIIACCWKNMQGKRRGRVAESAYNMHTVEAFWTSDYICIILFKYGIHVVEKLKVFCFFWAH